MIVTANLPLATTEDPSDDAEAPAPGMVKGPYTVATFQVSVEKGRLYLVVDVADLNH